ncbi:aquaporin Z [Aquihabitans sp. McL0605]|uniref:aquaporin Z n=1 Tax=Aquihabitans sp. McL0605 TaxID=3415671 RepID=UPI003CF92652
MTMQRRLAAEVFGTFWLVLGGCGSAIFAANFLTKGETQTSLGIGFLGVAFAFGLTVLTMAYAVGHISGGHFNPAVTIGAMVSGRFDKKDAAPYIVAQVIGGIIAAGVLYAIAKGQPGWKIDNTQPGAFAANGYGKLSPGHYGMGAAFLAETVLTVFFLLVILGATAKKAAAGFGGMAIGLALVLIHLISIPITNTSVNPARSTSQAIFAGGDYIPQLWLFWVAPILGAVIGGLIWKYLLEEGADEVALVEGVEVPGNAPA